MENKTAAKWRQSEAAEIGAETTQTHTYTQTHTVRQKREKNGAK